MTTGFSTGFSTAFLTTAFSTDLSTAFLTTGFSTAFLTTGFSTGFSTAFLTTAFSTDLSTLIDLVGIGRSATTGLSIVTSSSLAAALSLTDARRFTGVKLYGGGGSTTLAGSDSGSPYGTVAAASTACPCFHSPSNDNMPPLVKLRPRPSRRPSRKPPS